LACGLSIGDGLGQPGQAQTQLPEMVVAAPPPVQRNAPSAAAAPPTTAPAPLEPVAAEDVSPAGEPLLTTADFAAHTSAQLGNALADKPGIAASAFAPGASRPILRGLSGFRVGISENGLASGDVSALSDDHAVAIDPNAARRVEVLRGPASLWYGPAAIGGIVNASNTRIPEAPPPHGVMAEAQGNLSRGDSGRNGSAILEAGAGTFVVHADAFQRVREDYRIPGGRQANTGLESEGYALGGSYLFKEGFIGLAVASFDSSYFIPGKEAAAEKNHIDLVESKWMSKGEWRLDTMGVQAIRFAFGATDYRHDEVDGLGSAAVIGSTFLNKQYQARIEAQLQPIETGFGALRSAVGSQWSERRLSAAGEEGVLLPPALTQSLAVFLLEDLRLSERLRLEGAVRLEANSVEGTASRFSASVLPPPDDPIARASGRHFLPLSASVGVLYELPLGFVARLIGQHVERAPDATELFYRGPHDATQTFEIGTPGLLVEAANTIELGFKRAKGDFRFDVSAYHTDFKNFIFKRFTGAKCDDDFASCGLGGTGTLDQIIFAQGNATFIGAELRAEQDIGGIWQGVWGIDGQYDFVRATFGDGSFVPKMPPHRLGGGLYYRDANWSARLNLLHAFAQQEYAAFDTPTPAYNLLNAELSYTVKLTQQGEVVPEMTIGLRGENLLNDDIRYSTSFKKDEVLQPGTSLSLFGRVKLN